MITGCTAPDSGQVQVHSPPRLHQALQVHTMEIALGEEEGGAHGTKSQEVRLPQKRSPLSGVRLRCESTFGV